MNRDFIATYQAHFQQVNFRPQCFTNNRLFLNSEKNFSIYTLKIIPEYTPKSLS